ncbi:MAG TPA: CpaD family pilus assembly lipoprotein [Stellaceae bacterium]|nr:CpaD family pilus assembly lipoprotein [Stellaceae bacterium]
MRSDQHAFMMYAMPLFLAAALLATGCTPQPARWTPAEAPKANKVDFVTVSHEVQFPAGASAPTSNEVTALSRFLENSAVGYGDQVTIDTGPRNGNPASDQLAARRLQAVTVMLRQHGIEAHVAARPTVDGALARNGVAVTIGRYVVTPPACPDYSKPEADDFNNTPSSNYGCATTANLGLMVANPGDLVHGQTLGPADGDFAARGVQLYRNGQIAKTLAPELSGAAVGGH